MGGGGGGGKVLGRGGRREVRMPLDSTPGSLDCSLHKLIDWLMNALIA